MSIFVEIGGNILSLRQSRGLTQEQLAQKTGMSVSYLRMIEKGQANPTIKTLSRLADALNVPFNRVALVEDSHES